MWPQENRSVGDWAVAAQLVLASVARSVESLSDLRPVFFLFCCLLQIYLYYGSRRNAHLLTYAGFVDAQHRNDEMIFELSIDGKPWATAVPLTGNGPAEAAAALTASPASPTPVDPLLKIKLMLLAKVGMGSGFLVKLPLLDRPDGFEGATGNRFTAAKEAKEAAEAAASASGSGDAQDPEAAARALSAAQEAKQAARASFRALLHFLRVACLATKETAALALKHKPDGFGQRRHAWTRTERLRRWTLPLSLTVVCCRCCRCAAVVLSLQATRSSRVSTSFHLSTRTTISMPSPFCTTL